jgi:putative transposase
MARVQSTTSRSVLNSVISNGLILSHAETFGVVRRRRKVDIVALVWSLVLGFQVGADRTIEGLRHAYQRAAGRGIVRSSFYKRLNTRLAKLLRKLALEAMDTLRDSAAAPRGYLSGFRELLAIDATVLRLHKLLAKNYAGSRTNHSKAAAKLHMVMNVIDGSPRKVRVTDGRTGDTVPWRYLGQWVQGSILLIDLGYYSFQLLDRIGQNGGFYVSRMKSNANQKIIADNRPSRGRSIDVVGKTIQDVLPRLKRKTLDVEVELKFKRRPYAGHRSRGTCRARLVAVYDEKAECYHGYFTNIPPERLASEDIRYTYALRWQVEILFKTMKQHGHLDHLPSRKKAVVDCLIWASVLSLIASQALFRRVRQAIPRERYVPLLRWSSLFSRVAEDLLWIVLSKSGRTSDAELLELLLREAPDPNRQRKNRGLEYVWFPPMA